MSDKHFVGMDLTGFQDNRTQRPISRVTLLADDENAYTAGDDTGLELTADCPHATLAMAESILSRVKGYACQMFAADDANLDPAAELGDGITAGGVYGTIARLSEDGSGYASVTAPGEEDLEDEYPAGGPMTQAFNRQIAQTRSQILKTADSIMMKVENEIDGLNGRLDLTASSLTAEIEDLGNGLNSKIEQTAKSISTEINGLDGKISSVVQYADRISARVEDLNGSVQVTLDTLNGLTVTDASGSTRIKGSSIDTSTITANSISADKLNLTGSLTFDDLNQSARDTINDAVTTANTAKSTANSAVSTANSVKTTVGGWTYEGTTYMDGRKLMIGTVQASVLRGGEVQLLNSNEETIGTIGLDTEWAGSDWRGAVTINSDSIILSTESSWGIIRLVNQECFLEVNPTTRGGTGIRINGNLLANGSSVYDIGSNVGGRWNDIYITNDPIVYSDRNKKTEISYSLELYEKIFDSLRPAKYRFINGQSGRTHLGLIAQDVEDALANCGLTSMDFAGFIKSPRKDDAGNVLEGEYDYALRYGEFIAMLIDQTKKIKSRVSELERRLTS